MFFYTFEDFAKEISKYAKEVMERKGYDVPRDFNIRNIAEDDVICEIGIALYGPDELYFIDGDDHIEKISDQEYMASGTLNVCYDDGVFIDYKYTYDHKPNEEEVFKDICKEWDISMDIDTIIVNICKKSLKRIC